MRLWRYRTTIVQANWKVGVDAFNEWYHGVATHMLDLGGVLRTDEPGRGRDEALADPIPSSYNSDGIPFAPYVYENFKHGDLFYPLGMRRDGQPQQFQDLGPEARAEVEKVWSQGRTVRDLGPDAHKLLTSRLEMSLQIAQAHPFELDYIKGLKELPLDMEISDFMNNLRREAFRAQGIDLSRLTDYQLNPGILSINFFPNLSGPIQGGSWKVYRFRPNGWDPDSFIWDVMFLGRYPEGAEPRVQKEYYPDWRAHDGWGAVLLQDLLNMPEVQVGMHQSALPGLTLGRQEACVRHFHEILGRYVES
jgi:hypothetical protein